MTNDPDKIEAEFEAGHELGRYRIESAVGQGGMGTVYAAYDGTTNRLVALKILAPGLSAALRERFLAECEAQARIRHPNVMPVYDRAWLTDERPYFTMELLYDPITLADVVAWAADGSLSKRHARLRHWADPRKLIQDVILPAARGIAAANNEYGIQHRDLKPDNLLVDVRTRRAYVIDFGICRPIDDPTPEERIVGTPRFLSPEQARGQVDLRTDVWGLGANLHFLLSGEPPLDRSSPFSRKDVAERVLALKKAELRAKERGEDAKARGFEARRAQLEDPAFRTLENLYKDARAGTYLPLPENVPSALRAIVRKAMAPTPSERYDHAGELVADLEAWLEGGTVVALADEGAGAAVADKARRAIARNLITGVATAVALGVGTLVGMALFKEDPLRPDYRQEDAEARGAAFAARAVTIRNRRARMDLRAQYHAWEDMRARANNLVRLERAGLLLGDPSPQMRVNFMPRPVEIDGPGPWTLENLSAPTSSKIRQEGSLSLEPGLWLASRRPSEREGGASVHLLIPVTAEGLGERTGPPAPLEVTPPLLPADVLDGTTWVPGAEGSPGTLVATTWVTNGQYAEWIDELPASEREAHVPPAGFHRGDPSDNTRWITRAGMATRPVLGLSAKSIRAYVAWRAEIRGLPLRLPTAEEWAQVAGLDALEWPSARERLFPHARTPRLSKEPTRTALGAVVRRTLAQPREVVASSSGELVWVLGGADGVWVPNAAALQRTSPFERDRDGGAFRLAQPLSGE